MTHLSHRRCDGAPSQTVGGATKRPNRRELSELADVHETVTGARAYPRSIMCNADGAVLPSA